MHLFQRSALCNYLSHIDPEPIETAYETYRRLFLPKIANIQHAKEEQYSAVSSMKEITVATSELFM